MGKKTIAVVVVVMLLAGALAIWHFVAGLDARVADAIERAGSETFQVDVEVYGVDVNLREARVRAATLAIGNPAGFSSANAVELSDIAVRIVPRSLTQDVLEVAELTAAEPLVRLEMKPSGTSNLGVLRDNIGSATARDDAEAMRMIINRLEIAGMEVHATVNTPGGDQEERRFSLPAIRMRDIGRSQGGLTPEQVARIVGRELLDETIAAATRQDLKSLLEKQAERLKDQLLDRLGDD